MKIAIVFGGVSFEHEISIVSSIAMKDVLNEELTIEFLRSFAMNAKINLHINVLYGENGHHIHESIFKAPYP